MSSIWRQVVILIRLYWIWSEVSADGEILETNVMLTWNESRKYCEDIGKVLFDAKKTDYEASLRKILKDTNQAWVSARVKFSQFVKEPACMARSKQFAAKASFDTDIIGSCLKFCNGYLYAGVQDMDCYCFKDSRNLTRSMSCNSTCNNDTFRQCGGNESISLYEKVKHTACRDYKWTVASDKLCRMDRVDSLRWKQARQYCADIGGHLMSSRIPRINNMIENSTYWFGFHRIPMKHKMNTSLALELVTNDTCCAVARKEGDLVLIEGDDCRAKHAIICQDESLERSSASPQSTEKPIPGERSKSRPTDGKIIYVVVAVSAMLLVALVITALVCIFRRRQVSQERANGIATHSTRQQHAFLGKQISSPPSKPSRKTHTKKENLQSSYENVIFVRGRQDVAIHQLGYSNCEYENIILDKAHVQENDYKNGDTHESDHGSLHRNEEQ